MEEKILYIVKISDNTKYQEPEDDVTEGAFATHSEALKKCQDIVDEALKNLYYEGMGADELFNNFVAYGQEPYIESEDKDGPQFSAWKYAKERSSQVPQGILD